MFPTRCHDREALPRASRKRVAFPDVAKDVRDPGIRAELEGHRSGDADLTERRNRRRVIGAHVGAAAGLAVAALEPRQRVAHAGDPERYPGSTARREKDRD